jgi:hypothetical protein
MSAFRKFHRREFQKEEEEEGTGISALHLIIMGRFTNVQKWVVFPNLFLFLDFYLCLVNECWAISQLPRVVSKLEINRSKLRKGLTRTRLHQK